MQSQNSCEDGLHLWEHSEFKPRALRSAHSLLPHSHKTCPLVLKRVKIMFTIVLGPRWTHQRPDHLFTTGLGGAGKDHDPCRHRSSPMPQQASQDSPRRSTSLCSHRWLAGHMCSHRWLLIIQTVQCPYFPLIHQGNPQVLT